MKITEHRAVRVGRDHSGGGRREVRELADASVPGVTSTLRAVGDRPARAAGSRRRLHGKKLAVANWNEAGRKPGGGRHQCDERGHLLNVRRRVIHDQQASRA